ncbi:hypothetical protein P170DRAFT_461193 [Aspergillus steynii IBT 23096]|uniref:Fungal-type protein kinase domain-containing protein n=1 Tax=Aspergillus steynii IBT 23096 TaxID=1392250 RepID=A0A2I2GQZ4_9EURO|nr:uncharacterized protein P170DRAFT_461193 [Aspergillus steynii IBT 23096]PLB55281.1 hypothetical protein P170DRAFT_461193 [Aspergillus steynii IBT 23096]
MKGNTERDARRRAVRAVKETISHQKDLLIYEHKDLDQHAPIQVLPMPLTSDGDPKFKSEFFDPFRKPLPDPDEDIQFCPASPKEPDDAMSEGLVVGNYFKSYIWDGIYRGKADKHNNPMQPIDFPRCSLWEFEFEDSIDWRSGGIADSPDGPWIKCIFYDSVNPNDHQITRGEILCICRIMTTCLSRQAYSAHYIIPVLLLSFVGPRHARILLAHHDGTNLVIRQSDRFALWEKDIPKLKVLLRWWCSSGIGDTGTTKAVSE